MTEKPPNKEVDRTVERPARGGALARRSIPVFGGPGVEGANDPQDRNAPCMKRYSSSFCP
jgi:hypothetical protein